MVDRSQAERLDTQVGNRAMSQPIKQGRQWADVLQRHRTVMAVAHLEARQVGQVVNGLTELHADATALAQLGHLLQMDEATPL